MWSDQCHEIARMEMEGETDETSSTPASQMDAPSDEEGDGDVNGVCNSLSKTRLSPPALQSIAGTSQPHARDMTQNLAIEHRIFLRAILDLLAERDQTAVVADVDGPNTIKIGSLRKASHRIKGLWKAKYVEIRRGTFSYFDDTVQKGDAHTEKTSSSINEPNLLRKDIPLRDGACVCRAVKIRSVKVLPKNSGGAVFELQLQGGSRRLWMANTQEERKAWIQAIHKAMIGASVTRGDNFLEYQVELTDRQKHNVKGDVPQYMDVRTAAHYAETKEEYLKAISCMRGCQITVPVQWIKAQVEDTADATTFKENCISSSIEQLWKDLMRDSVSINGEVLAGESFHGPERIVGKLTQQILESDESLHTNGKTASARISEARAISYSRDILLACNRTRSGGDSYFCAENLCLNRNLVVLCPASNEASPLSITVSGRRKNGSTGSSSDISGWASARNSPGKPWKRQYLVLSHSVLSCYAEGEPKPHELLEQLVLHDVGAPPRYKMPKASRAASSQSKESEYVVHIRAKNGRVARDLLFADEFDYLLWRDALEKAAAYSQERFPIQQQNGGHENGTGNSPVVDVTVDVGTDYKLCTIDPSGNESDDTWASLRTTFVQEFTLTGGQKGNISRGDEAVRLELL
ncbi:hypothetical protein ACHAXT_006911 [Thalassiosira profunda]